MKKLGKILLWTSGIVLVLLVVVGLGLKLLYPTEKLKTIAIEQGSAALGRDIRIGNLDFSFWGGLGVELQQVEIGNPDGLEGPDLLAAGAVELKLRLLPLLTGDIRVDRLIIDSPTVNLLKSADGRLNYRFEMGDSAVTQFDSGSQPMTPADLPPEGQAAALAISFEELEIKDAHLTYRDESTGTEIGLIGFDLSSSLQTPSEGQYLLAGRAGADSLTLGRGDEFPPYAIGLNYTLEYDLERDLLTIERVLADINDLRLDFSGEVSSLLEQPSAVIGIRSDNGHLAGLLSLLGPQQRRKLEGYQFDGNFDLDLDFDYTAGEAVDAMIYTGTATLTDVVFASSQIEGELRFDRCLIDFEPDNLRMNIENGSFADRPLKGHLLVDDFDNPLVSGELAGSLDLKMIEPFLPSESEHQMSGQALFDLKVSGPVKEVAQLNFSGNLVVDSGSYNSVLLPEPVDQFDLEAYFDRNLINVRRLECRVASGQLGFTGRLNDLVGYLLSDTLTAAPISPSMEATVEGGLDLAIAQPYLPEIGSPQLSGQMTLDARFTGSMDNLEQFHTYGRIAIKDAAYTDSLLPEPIESFEASLRLRPDTIEIESLAARFTSSDLSLRGSLIRPFPYFLPILALNRDSLPKPLLLFAVESNRFDVDKLFPEAVPGSSVGQASASVAVDSVSTVILPEIEGRGTVKADTVIYSKVEFTQAEAKVRIKERRIECYEATARVYTGGVAGKTTIDLSDFNQPRYKGSFEATQVEADDFLSRFTRFGGHLFGKGNFTGTYDALGWEPEAFLNSLTLNGDVDVRDGRVVTSGPVYEGLSQLASLVQQEFEAEQTVRNLTNSVRVQDGRVRADAITGTLGNLGDFAISGSYGFDQTLEYAGRIYLSREQRRKLGINLDSLPLTVRFGGTIDQPEFEIDLAELVKATGEGLLKDELDKVKDKAKDALRGLFGN